MYKLNDLLTQHWRSRNVSGARLFDHISFNDVQYWLSVQASLGHYCTPRKMLPKEQYTSFEVMAEIPFMDIPSYWEDRYESGGVYGYVPREEIEKLIQALADKYGLDF